jgi:hypothetical protein
VLRRERDGWVIIHDHTSVNAGPPRRGSSREVVPDPRRVLSVLGVNMNVRQPAMRLWTLSGAVL